MTSPTAIPHKRKLPSVLFNVVVCPVIFAASPDEDEQDAAKRDARTGLASALHPAAQDEQKWGKKRGNRATGWCSTLCILAIGRV
jgi:hypothetical protein